MATALATGLGTGYSLFIPGTVGSLLGVILFWPLAGLTWQLQLGATLLLFVAAVPSATLVARRTGVKDPGLIVVDEILGMWISLLFLPWKPSLVAVAFAIFRIADIVKPPPARDLEALPGGWGIVLDDVMAGVYTNLALRALLAVQA